MIAGPLGKVLEATGYLVNGQGAAPSVGLAGSGTHARLPSFEPDAWWRGNIDANSGGAGGPTVYFKYAREPQDSHVADWQREVWNQGSSPLLWVVSPERTALYNGFGEPRPAAEAQANRLDTFQHVEQDMARLDARAGRLAMETGHFWSQEKRVDRDDRVDSRLLRDLQLLESTLLKSDLARDQAQALIGRCIFAQYLVDRKIVTGDRLSKLCGQSTLPNVLSDRATTERLFAWLSEKFNGDMFPPEATSVPDSQHIELVARFLRGEDLETRQLHFFPYRFDVIPVELVSAIYEQFVHSASEGATGAKPARSRGVFYTPLAAVSLVLDEVCAGLTGDETVLDLSCGSGVFLIEALRRLVHAKARGGALSRSAIRQTLYNQIYGVDIEEAAVRLAAFSLYLAAMELDPQPQQLDDIQFEPLRDTTLLVGSARNVERTSAGQRALTRGGELKKFDIIVGNPPWTSRERAGAVTRRDAIPGKPLQSRGQGLAFLSRAMDFAHYRTRFGMVLSATPFFSLSSTTMDAVQQNVEELAPVTLVNLSDLSKWLFPRANMPAIVLLARHRDRPKHRMTLVQAHWSHAGERSRTIELSPNDVTTLPIASWKRCPGLFKAAFVGQKPDLLLLDQLVEDHQPLGVQLKNLGTQLRGGLTFGNRSRDATFLKGLPFARRDATGPFSLEIDELPAFSDDRAERPRDRGIYRAPLLLVNEFLRQAPLPRMVVAVAERDVVYTSAIFGASFANSQLETAYLVAGILGSAMASWYLLMTGSVLGLWMRRLRPNEINEMPVPVLEPSVASDAGQRVIRLVRDFHRQPPGPDEWKALDEAVFDLYGLDDEDRMVVRDGLLRASWQWKEGRSRSVEPVGVNELQTYARAFLTSMDVWFSALNRRRMRAIIYDLPEGATHRVVRFVVEDRPGPSVCEVSEAQRPLRSVLAEISDRTEADVVNALVGKRELRVHSHDEVSLVKPAALRHWLGVCGLEDAGLVVRDGARDMGSTSCMTAPRSHSWRDGSTSTSAQNDMPSFSSYSMTGGYDLPRVEGSIQEWAKQRSRSACETARKRS